MEKAIALFLLAAGLLSMTRGKAPPAVLEGGPDDNGHAFAIAGDGTAVDLSADEDELALQDMAAGRQYIPTDTMRGGIVAAPQSFGPGADNPVSGFAQAVVGFVSGITGTALGAIDGAFNSVGFNSTLGRTIANFFGGDLEAVANATTPAVSTGLTVASTLSMPPVFAALNLANMADLGGGGSNRARSDESGIGGSDKGPGQGGHGGGVGRGAPGNNSGGTSGNR